MAVFYDWQGHVTLVKSLLTTVVWSIIWLQVGNRSCLIQNWVPINSGYLIQNLAPINHSYLNQKYLAKLTHAYLIQNLVTSNRHYLIHNLAAINPGYLSKI